MSYLQKIKVFIIIIIIIIIIFHGVNSSFPKTFHDRYDTPNWHI